MVKGCQKRTIHIKDTGSRFYEEAYFVLRPGIADADSNSDDMVKEAIRIAGERVAPGKMPGRGAKSRRSLGSFFTGFALGMAFFALLVLIFG